MDFFIPLAYAADPASQSGSSLLSLLPLVFLFIVFYFLLIRPQTKRVKEHKNMVSALKKGDEVVTNGGLLGKIVDLGDNFIILEVSVEPDIHLKIQREAVAAVMPKGTIKEL